MPLNLANSRVHWAAKLRKHNEWKTRALVGEKGLRGRHRQMQRVRVTAVVYVGRGPYMDDDNVTLRACKWPFDYLKERGLIVDDKRPHLTLTGIPEQRQGNPKRVVLTIEEVA